MVPALFMLNRRMGKSAHFTNSKSPGFHVPSNAGFSGSLMRKWTNHPLPGIVLILLTGTMHLIGLRHAGIIFGKQTRF